MRDRGYFGIGIENGQHAENMGALLRSATCFDADYVFATDTAYHGHPADTPKTPRHTPLFRYPDTATALACLPDEARLVVADANHGRPLHTFDHPEQAVYWLGNERVGPSPEALAAADAVVQIDAEHALNVATAGAILMWHRRYVGRLGPHLALDSALDTFFDAPGDEVEAGD